MLWSSHKVENNKLYRIELEKTQVIINEIVTTELESLCQSNWARLSLFGAQPFSQQLKAFQDLTESLPDFYFMLRGDTSACIWDLYLKPELTESKFKSELAKSDFDYLFWPQENINQPPQLLLFDMDSTFIEIEVIDELAKRHNVGQQVIEVTEAAMRGELDFAESLVSRVKCLKGLTDDAIDQVASSLPVSKGVPELVDKAHHNGAKVAIVSGGFTPFVEKLKHSMSLFKVHANRLEIEEGQLTGRVLGEIVDAEAKAIFLRELCNQLEIVTSQTMAIGDGANDLKMMQEAGFNLAYKAKPKVQQAANGRINQTDLSWISKVFGW